MKRLLALVGTCVALVVALVVTYQTPLPAGQVTTLKTVGYTTPVSGATLYGYSSVSGVSHIGTIDLKDAGDQLSGLFSAQLGTAIFAQGTASPGGTGNAATDTAAAGISVFYLSSNTALTATQLASRTQSGVSLIVSLPFSSSATPYTTHRFEPEFARFIYLFAQAGNTNILRPPVYFVFM